MSNTILILEGDGIGPEIIAEARKVLACLCTDYGLQVELCDGLIGGAAFDATGDPLPADTLERAKQCQAVLLGAVGGPQYETLPRDKRPEKGLLRLRAELGLFANLRPALLFPELACASSLKPEVVSGLDILIVRELTGGIYFGQPRGIRNGTGVEREAYNTMIYSQSEIERIARCAFEIAMLRHKQLCSVDKANVLEVSELWRDVMSQVAESYPQVALRHVYVDNAAMQLVKDPKQFDVIVTENMFGDILSDVAAMLTGSIGMLPSASLNSDAKGMYEPIHGSAPDIAGSGIANPLATILSVAMMLRYTLRQEQLAQHVERAVATVLAQGLRTADIYSDGTQRVSTSQMGDAVVSTLQNQS